MSSKKIVVVVGATGSQGGSVARYLLNDGTFAVRAITRNPDSPAARELAAKGAEVVKADVTELASLEKAFEGAYGVFGVTNFWAPGVGFEGEVSQGKLLVDAAKATGIQHFVWSTLDSTEFQASHWESKHMIDQYLKKSGVPRTSIYTTFYFENFAGQFAPQKRDDGSYRFPPLRPDAPFAVYSVDETGAFALAALRQPEQWIDKDMRVASEFLSIRQAAEVLNEVSGKTVHVMDIDKETWASLRGNPFPEELHDNFSLLFAYAAPPFRDTELSRNLYPGMKSFRKWAEDNVSRIFPA